MTVLWLMVRRRQPGCDPRRYAAESSNRMVKPPEQDRCDHWREAGRAGYGHMAGYRRQPIRIPPLSSPPATSAT